MKHKIRARCKAVEVHTTLYSFEMIVPRYDLATKTFETGGVRFKKYRSSKWKTISFERIAEGNETLRTIEGSHVRFVLGESGVTIKVEGERGERTVPFEALANLGKRQPVLV